VTCTAVLLLPRGCLLPTNRRLRATPPLLLLAGSTRLHHATFTCRATLAAPGLRLEQHCLLMARRGDNLAACRMPFVDPLSAMRTIGMFKRAPQRARCIPPAWVCRFCCIPPYRKRLRRTRAHLFARLPLPPRRSCATSLGVPDSLGFCGCGPRLPPPPDYMQITLTPLPHYRTTAALTGCLLLPLRFTFLPPCARLLRCATAACLLPSTAHAVWLGLRSYLKLTPCTTRHRLARRPPQDAATFAAALPHLF